MNIQGRLTDVEEFENVIIRTQPDGSILRVRDVADVELGARSYTSSSRREGKPSSSMLIFQFPGANALQVADNIRSFMEEAKRSFRRPQSEITYENTPFVRAALTEVMSPCSRRWAWSSSSSFVSSEISGPP